MTIPCSIMLFPPNEGGSKSNIAAKFQNALNLHFLPPIGVFWDIENCQVPKGKSAIALVQNIREKFFANHREAEFMCVCDINKERKTVIQELILAQVTVVHISATSKNAADDKLKQCMRRFVDTHGAPATLLLISEDVNFSSDLSDFRHRHNIRIILIHRGRAHQSLLACAHEHYEFSTIAFDLPSRNPAKSPDRRPTVLMVTDLPTNKSAGQLRNVLRKLSQNCGGKVSVRGNKALIKFATPDAAERAQKRMDKEYVYGYEISVTFYGGSENDFNLSPFKKNKELNSSNEASGTSSSSRDSSTSPSRENGEIHKPDKNYHTGFDFPPPPVLEHDSFPSLLKNHASLREPPSQNFPESSVMFPAPPNLDIINENKSFQLDWNIGKILNRSSASNRDFSAFSPFKKDERNKFSQKNVGRVTPFLMQNCDKNRSTQSEPGGIRSFMGKTENTSDSYIFSNRGYQNTMQGVGSSFEVPQLNKPYFYSPTWNGVTAVSDTALPIPQNMSIENSCVELHVSNLDPSFEVNEMKKILLSVFGEHVMVLHTSMSLQPDGSPKATVKVPSLQDAQYAISRLHRKKIGHKRILISHVSSNKIPPFHILRSETIALLNDIPNKSLPLIKFRELYEKRYHRPIAVSELYKMREAVTIQGDSGSRIVFLNTEYCNTPSLPESEDSQDYNIIERPYCEVHFHVSESQGWAEQYNICPLPLVNISLKVLSTAVHRLLDSHQGSLPLISFCDCYEAEIGPLPIVGNFDENRESFEVSLGANQTSASKGVKGVPLEHLIACIAGVEVAKSVLCIKKVQWLENKNDPQTVLQNFSPALMGQLNLFGREVMDLLKSQPQCLVQFNKFIPTYHHHFGRQCRVADYGFTKLIDLLEAIPHIVQVLGEGQNRQVTLTHKTQVKRFSGELNRILKSRASKQIAVSEFAQAYELVIEKPFDITNYGVCEIEDMISEIPENVIVTTGSGSETVISIPKREQNAEEIERTKQFAEEVIELMKHTTNCSMAFNKFIPSYHHHFGKQCRVSDYGFSKLIELFEVIPNVLEVKGSGEDKILYLVKSEQHKILTERLISVLKVQPKEIIDITQLCNAYAQVHGHALRPSDFGFANLEELLEEFRSTIKVVNYSQSTYICLANHELIRQVSLNIKSLLMEQKDGKISLEDLYTLYTMRFQQNINILSFICDLSGVIEVSQGIVQLAPLQLLARDIIILLQENGAHIPLNNLGNLFHKKYGFSFAATDYGFQNMTSMLEHFSDYFVLKGKRQKRVVGLTSEMIDLLHQPLPSCIPRPILGSTVKDNVADLMGFETPPIHDLYHDTNASLGLESLKEISTIPGRGIYQPFRLVTSAERMSRQNSSNTSFMCSPADVSLHLPSTSYVKCKEAATDFSFGSEASHFERDSSETCTAQPPSKFELKLDIKFQNSTERSPKKYNGYEHPILKSNKCAVDSHAFDVEMKYNSHSLGIKEDDHSTKGNPATEGKQSRRNRIAAHFSSPIND